MAFNKWSNSALMTFQMCGYKGYLRHIKRDRRPSGPVAKRGIAVHKVALEGHKRQMMTLGKWHGADAMMTENPGTPRAQEEARDLAAAAFENAVDEGVSFSKEDREAGVDVVLAHAKDAAVDLSGLYVDQVAPPIEPTAVERKIVIKPKDMDITLEGYIDLVEKDDGDVIRDLKTKEKSPWEGEAKVSQQLTMYHLIRMAETGVLPRAGRLVHLVRTPKRHDLNVVTQETTRDADDIAMIVRRLNTAVEAVNKGVFVPADESAPGSPCSYCEYADGTCPYVRKRK